jgi:DNA repair protein RadC
MTNQTKLTVKDWSPEDQPREKLLLKGVYALSDAELLAIILGSGNCQESVVQLSQRILQSAENNINQLGKLSIKQLMKFKGIGEAKAVSIVAALELGKRRKADDLPHRERIYTSNDIYRYFQPLLCDLPHEEFWALFLNRANKVIDKWKISQGGVSGTVVDPRMVYKEAINRLATSVAVCHNHPSGNAHPSPEDNQLTGRLNEGLKLIDITLIDHVIVCEDSYFSYADEGRI